MKDGEIKHKLSPAQVSVMLHRVTEPPYFGRFWDHFEDGTYRCAACDTALFSSEDKFDSKTGWPSFKKPLNERDLQFKSETGPDDKIELRCKKCKGHLGYVISGDNPYYRINSVCLLFEKRASAPVIAPTAEDAKNGKKIETIPAASSLIIEPMPESTPWNARSLATGAVIGLLIGGLGIHLYEARLSGVQIPPNATSTSETASSTDVSMPIETPKNESMEEQPAPEPQPVESTAPESETTATSTQ